jgi:LPPG:FO 2-phospho-L-lactate transferase
MRELGLEVSAAAVARRYGNLIDAYVVDPVDAVAAPALEVRVVAAPVLMVELADREALARTVLALADDLRSAR